MLNPPNKAVNASPSTNTPSVNQHDTGANTRQRLGQAMAGRGVGSAHGGQLTGAADPNSALPAYRMGFQDTGRICTGVIMDGVAIANCYRVHVDHGICPVIASASSHSSQACLGATAINTYAPGTRVLVAVDDKEHKAVILGTAPEALNSGKRAYHDYISPMARKRVDDVHKKYIKQPFGNFTADWSAWMPYDSTCASEWGAVSTTGGAITLDDFMLRASINEFCGIYGFYHDSLLRVAGYNMQVWTAGSERDAYMDQAECNDATGYAPYPWEAIGSLQETTAILEYQAQDYQCSQAKPYYMHWENKHEFAQPYHRSQVFFGYLGQGGRRVVHAPPPGLQWWTYDGKKGPTGSPPFDSTIQAKDGPPMPCGGGPSKDTDHNPKPAIGLNEQNDALDGRIFMASAKGITITKRILLPMPQRVKRPEDIKEGDDASKNYKASSKHGSGPEHKITGDIKTTDTKYPNLQRATAVLDLHGYLFNYAGLHPFYWHAKDYKTWEQQDLSQHGLQYNQEIPEFSQLAGSKMYLEQPQEKTLKIDHRYNTQKFYQTECFISLLEDGGVVIGDGYGAEIRMVGGCVFISAPGDVWMKGGRDVQTWAGNDSIVRANKTVDISATEKNVRIKSEKNVLVLAGNGGQDGGILLESRGTTDDYDFEECGDKVKFSGVVARAPKSNVVSLAKQIYLRTGGGDVQPGDITIDASKGDKDLITKSNNVYQFLQRSGRMYHFFGQTDYQKANMFSEQVSLLAGRLGTERDIIAGGGILAQGSILVSKGHIVTESASRGAIFVAPCDGDCQAQVNEGIELIRKLIDDDIPQIGSQIDQQVLEMKWYTEKKAGNDRVMSILEFSFRTDDDYKIPDFLLYEDRWQQMARLGGKSPEKWTEKPVKSKACDETWPFPGKKWLNEEQAFVEQDFKIVQPSGGYIDKPRGKAPGLAGEYREPEFKPNTPKKLNGNYPIIPRN
jgi:hypothetical protein